MSRIATDLIWLMPLCEGVSYLRAWERLYCRGEVLQPHPTAARSFTSRNVGGGNLAHNTHRRKRFLHSTRP